MKVINYLAQVQLETTHPNCNSNQSELLAQSELVAQRELVAQPKLVAQLLGCGLLAPFSHHTTVSASPTLIELPELHLPDT